MKNITCIQFGFTLKGKRFVCSPDKQRLQWTKRQKQLKHKLEEQKDKQSKKDAVCDKIAPMIGEFLTVI